MPARLAAQSPLEPRSLDTKLSEPERPATPFRKQPALRRAPATTKQLADQQHAGESSPRYEPPPPILIAAPFSPRLSRHSQADDRWRIAIDVLGFGLEAIGLGILSIESLPSGIDRVGQQRVHTTKAPQAAAARAVAMLVQPARNRLHPHRPRAVVAFRKQSKDKPHGLCLDHNQFISGILTGNCESLNTHE